MFPDQFQYQKQREKNILRGLYQALGGGVENQAQLPTEGFLTVCKAAAWANLEDNIVYSWWKDKLASGAPPPTPMEAKWALP